MLYTESAIESMQNAAQEVRNINNPNAKENDIVDSDICIDGSWQKRGHNSLNGVVTGISRENKKVLDVQIFSKFCHSCSKWESQKGTPEYEHWKMSHTCSKNHIGSAGSMESKGAINIFTNSLQKYNLRYAHYIGDGDTESYKKVTDTKPYGDFIPQKLECVGHVQKRLGTRLRKLRNEKKHEKLSDGKKISGKQRLTDKIINKMQNYYGMVIRQNPERLFDMKKSIGAVLWHCSDITDPEARHQFCPKNLHSWCKYQSDKITGMSTYKPSTSLPVSIKREIQKIFQDLSSDELLSRCLEGTTQNPNEAFNQLVWQRCPKQTFVSKNVLESGVYSSVLTYNDGFISLGNVFRKLDIKPGKYFLEGSHSRDCLRVENMDKKSLNISKERRKKLRAIRKGFVDKDREDEGGDTYSSGFF